MAGLQCGGIEQRLVDGQELLLDAIGDARPALRMCVRPVAGTTGTAGRRDDTSSHGRPSVTTRGDRRHGLAEPFGRT
ncbi:MAG: hypothetical protein KatS3mg010_1997 [Acidimicrobiia bacterium]|nr:MAG: hypothetical protein KatS3mg010_1997 [Acidimicrobiia bacterium]